MLVIDVDEDSNVVKMEGQDRPRKALKRKRVTLKPEEKASQMEDLRLELEGLFRYYKEVKEKKVDFDVGVCNTSSNMSAMVAVLMEESEVSLSKLVEEIHEKVKGNDGGVTVASVKSSVLFVGQRMMYGVPNAEADVFEDQSQTCLWCWEVMGFPLFSLILLSGFVWCLGFGSFSWVLFGFLVSGLFFYFWVVDGSMLDVVHFGYFL
jgi:chromatin assembly factor 1 subunit A